MATYSPLLGRAASSLPTEYDFVSDGLSPEEQKVLEWADSRLFGNQNFLDSEWGPDRWPVPGSEYYGNKGKYTVDDPLTDSELRLVSAQAVIAMMLEIDIQKKANGHHVVSWDVDSLDRVMDDLGIYPGQCVHCYGKTGCDTYEELAKNYGVILEEGHVHRELKKPSTRAR